jgi:serine/threonine protein kinase
VSNRIQGISAVDHCVGSAFYISPELFHRAYDEKTNVWSAGVCLYVIVAGYLANKLQLAFTMMQSNDQNVKQLLNMPDDMPDSYDDLYWTNYSNSNARDGRMLVICYNKNLYNFTNTPFKWKI